MKLTYRASLIFFLLFNAIEAYAGLQPLRILIRDHERLPLIGATVQLTRMGESDQFFTTTDQNGMAHFESIPDAQYIVNVRYMGFLPLESYISVTASQRQFEFQMREDVIALGAVEVTARRPIIRQEDDKMIIDPEPLVNISTNTLEVLEKTPGLFVDQDGGIYLGTAAPAAIYINGREQKMSNQDLQSILRSLPPGSVQQIEVLRTPSSKFDAASSGGIINIILKKGVKIGRFGSVSSGMNQGVYGNRFGGFSLNNSGERTTSYLNMNFNHTGLVEDLNSIRQLSLQNSMSQSARNRQKNDQGYIGYGLSYSATEHITLSYDGRINASLRRSDANNLTFIEDLSQQRISQNNNLNNNRARFISLQQDLGMYYKLDTLGSEWDTKFGLSLNNNQGNQDYRTDYILPIPGFILGDGENNQGRLFLLLQSDLTRAFPGRFKLETGAKSTFQDFNSQANYFYNQEDSRLKDAARTNAFNYQENINSAYFQASAPLPGDLLLKAGVRFEHTFMKGNQTVPSDTSFIINRTDWFPYLYLSRRIIEVAGYELRAYMIYRRTIGRPGYQSLNPYIRYVDRYLYETGNPALKPQFTDNIEANISVDNLPVFAIGRSQTRDIFTNVVYQDERSPDVAVRTYDNVGKSRETYFRGAAAIPPAGKYFFVAGAQYNMNEYEGLYENQPFSFSRGSWRLFTFHSLSLSRTTKFNMTGFMMINGQLNFYELKNFGQLNLSLNQSFMNRKLHVTLNARDVLRTMVTQFSMNQGSMIMHGDRYTDNQRIGINVRYSFGVRKRSEKREMPRFDGFE